MTCTVVTSTMVGGMATGDTVPGGEDASTVTDRADDLDRWYAEVRPRLVGVMAVVAGSRAEAEEVADEAIVRALERWGASATTQASFGWLMTVAMNVFRRARRRAGLFHRFASKQRAVETSADPDFSTEVLLAIAELPARQRQAIGLRYVLGLPTAEIAEVMEVTPGTVARTLFDARRQLGTTLGEPLAPDDDLGEPT